MSDFALGSVNTTSMTTSKATQQADALQRQFANANKELGNPSKLLSGDALVRKHAELKKASQQMEGIFVQQMIEAMDKTVDREDSIMGGGEGEEMFREMMNQNIAEQISTSPGGSGFGIADVMYRQLAEKLPPLPATTPQQASQQYALQAAHKISQKTASSSAVSASNGGN